MLPKNVTHLLQPLDLTMNASVKKNGKKKNQWGVATIKMIYNYKLYCFVGCHFVNLALEAVFPAFSCNMFDTFLTHSKTYYRVLLISCDKVFQFFIFLSTIQFNCFQRLLQCYASRFSFHYQYLYRCVLLFKTNLKSKTSNLFIWTTKNKFLPPQRYVPEVKAFGFKLMKSYYKIVSESFDLITYLVFEL